MKGEDYATKSAKWCFKRIGLVLLKSLLCLIVYLSVLSFFYGDWVWFWGLILMVLSLFPILNSVIIMVLFYTGINQRCALRTGALVIENFLLFFIITLICIDFNSWHFLSTYIKPILGNRTYYFVFGDLKGINSNLLLFIFYFLAKKIIKSTLFSEVELYFCNFISKVFCVLKHINLHKMQKS